MYFQDVFNSALHDSETARVYGLSRRLRELFADRAIIEGSDHDFRLLTFAEDGLCRMSVDPLMHSRIAVSWCEDHGIHDLPRQVWYEVEWEGRTLDVLMLTQEDDCSTYFWILAERESDARDFFRAVCSYEPDNNDKILVFESGHWEGRSGLRKAIDAVRFDSLVLAGGLAEEIRNDLNRFFDARPTYEALGAPWRRGLLLTGPPGNGKTHTIKALLNELGRPCLYVKSFSTERLTEVSCIRNVFARARRVAPCLLVFEDLDALINDENRSFFLNEMDGFACNTGIVTIATTNHPEKLDPAILQRPSRFDRKYAFELPGPAERLRFLELTFSALPEAARVPAESLRAVADSTGGFSFAFLKELVLASLLRHAAACDAQPLAAVLREQAEALRGQLGAGAQAPLR